MRIMLDAMYDGMQEYLEEIGWTVTTVQDIGSKNAKDRRVREHAKTHDMILVTQDKKSADIAQRNQIKTILITLGDISELVITKIQKEYTNQP